MNIKSMKITNIDLEKYRQNKQLWNDFTFTPVGDTKNYLDLNAAKRNEAFIALQFDLQKADEAFLQYLFQEEIYDRQKDPFQGISSALRRGGYLLSTFKNPENVWLFLQAKTANFDTNCGFDWEFLVSAGIDETFDFVEKSDNSLKKTFFDYVNDSSTLLSEENHLLQWEKAYQETYPKERRETDYVFWMDIALSLNNLAQAKAILAKFETQNDSSKPFLESLKYYKHAIKDWTGEIEIAERLLQFEKDTRLKAFKYAEIVDLYIQNKEKKKAWFSIQKALAELIDLDNIGKFNLSYAALELIAICDGDENFLKDCYAFIKDNIRWSYLSIVQLEKLLYAAQIMKDEKDTQKFSSLLNEEKDKFERQTIMLNDEI
jgi:hypothetical protein